MIDSIRPSSINEWEQFIDQVDPETYSWVEYQADAFAGLVMAPRKFLFAHYTEQIKEIEHKIKIVKSKDLLKDSYQEYIIEIIASNLAEQYAVSRDVLNWRIAKEVRIGNLVMP